MADRPQPDPQDRIPTIVQLTSRDGGLTKDGRMTNCYVDGKRVFRRPGMTPGSTTFGSGQGMTVFQNGLLVAGGSVIYRVISSRSFGTAVQPGNLGGMVAYSGYIYAAFSSTRHVWRSAQTSPLSFTDLGQVLPATLGGYGLITHAGRMLYLSSGPVVSTSTDGITWTAMAFPPAAALVLVSNGTRLFAYSDLQNGSTYYYTDNLGATAWSSGTISSPAGAHGTLSMTANGSVLWAIAYATGKVMTSTDGTTWTVTLTDTTMFPAAKGTSYGSAMDTLGGVLYAKGVVSTNRTLVASVDGVTWNSIATFPGTFNDSSESTQITHYNDTLAVYADSRAAVLSVTTQISAKGSVGSIAIPSNEQIDLVQNTSSTKLFIKGRNAAYVYNGATLTQVTDADYPTLTARGAVYLDGSYYVMEPDGTIWGSADDDPSSWASDNFISAEFEPDDGVCLAKYLNYVVALGQWTVEMFWDAGNATGSPLSPVQNGVILIGCAHGDSVVQVESTLLWIAQRKGQGSVSQKGRFIAMLKGVNYEQVSPPDVDRILDADDLASVYSCVVSLSGHTFYILTLGTTGVTLVYDLVSKLWGTWSRRTASSPVTITTLTQSNGLATATTSGAHSLSDGDFVTISGATQSGYNLSLPVTVTGTTTFTYPVAAATVSPATGSPVVTGSTESVFDMTASVNFNGTQLTLDVGTGNVWSLIQATLTDNSQPIDMRIRSNNLDYGNNERKFCSSVAAIADLTSSAATSLIRYTDDDYQSYSFYRRFDLSQVRNNLQRFGNFRRRAWEYRYNGTSFAHRLEALEVEIEQGNS